MDEKKFRKTWKKICEKCQNHCITQSKESTDIVFDSCVLFAGPDMVIDTCKATAGKCKFKALPMQIGICIKKVV